MLVRAFIAFSFVEQMRNWILRDSENYMQTTVTIDDVLYEKALKMAAPDIDEAEIFNEAIRVFIRVRAAKRPAAAGGTTATIEDVPRRAKGLVSQ